LAPSGARFFWRPRKLAHSGIILECGGRACHPEAVDWPKNLSFDTTTHPKEVTTNAQHQGRLLPEDHLNHLPQSKRSLARTSTRFHASRSRQTVTQRIRTRSAHRQTRLQGISQFTQRAFSRAPNGQASSHSRRSPQANGQAPQSHSQALTNSRLT